ncbi:MAG TPA: hypothetical protein VNJ70_06630 [Thermoanaerobaculia bacterium]|nr:hypothetical protein [Thermoanaerobaculia bacterium]
MPRETFLELLAEMDTLNVNLKAKLPDLPPHLIPLQADLEAWLLACRSLEAQQEVYNARLRETNESRRKQEARAIELRGQIRDALRGFFGGKNQTLREFLVKPRGGRRTPKKEEPPPAPTTPPPATPPPTS